MSRKSVSSRRQVGCVMSEEEEEEEEGEGEGEEEEEEEAPQQSKHTNQSKTKFAK